MRKIQLAIVCGIALLGGAIDVMDLVPGGLIAMAERYFNLFPEFIEREVVPMVERYVQMLLDWLQQ